MTAAPYRKTYSYNRQDNDYAMYLDDALIGFAATATEAQRRLDALVYDLLTKGAPEQRATIDTMAADAQAEVTRRHHRQADQILRLAGSTKRLSVPVPHGARPTRRYGAALWARLADGPAAELAFRQARQQPQATWDDLPAAWQAYVPALGIAQLPIGVKDTFPGGVIYAWGLEPTLQRFLDTLADYLMMAIVTIRQPDGSIVQHLTPNQAERAWVAAVLATYPSVPASLTTIPWWPNAPLHIATGLARLIGPTWQVAADGTTVVRTIPAPDAQGWVAVAPAALAPRQAA